MKDVSSLYSSRALQVYWEHTHTKKLVCKDALRFSLFLSLLLVCSHQGKLPLLLSRMNEVAKVFLATNSDYKYTDVSTGM